MCPINEDLRTLYYNALILLLSFEKYWSINNKTKGVIYRREAKLEAGKVCRSINAIRDIDHDIVEAEKLNLHTNTDEDVDMLLKDLENWSNNDEDYVQVSRKYFTRVPRLDFHILIDAIEFYISKKLRLPISPEIVISGEEKWLDLRVSEWLGQIHPELISLISPSFISEMNASDTIVLVGDIRRSQDLITYGPDSSFYTNMINDFIATVQQTIIDNNGIFDKFTGDGFIAYFNDALCAQNGSDYYNQMWLTCVNVMNYANSFISEWTKHLRKIPSEPIGLSIGVDSGSIFFSTTNNQMMAVGVPAVWATRMCSAGHQGEIVFNNLPYNNMMVKYAGMNFYDEIAKTKTGEDFVCHKIHV